MTSADLFLTHPVAWSAAQDLLAEESSMLARGLGAEQRIAFLEREVQRLASHAEVLMVETMTNLLDQWKVSNALGDLDDVDRRFTSFGQEFTLRYSRNTLRRMGMDAPVLDAFFIGLGMHLLADDTSFREALQRLLEHRLKALGDHPLVREADEQYRQISNDTSLLPSDRDTHLQRLALDVLASMEDEVEQWLTFEQTEARDLAFVRGALLDLKLSDLFSLAISTGHMTHLKEALKSSANEQTQIFQAVIKAVINDRIAEIRQGSRMQTTSVGGTGPQAVPAAEATIEPVRAEVPAPIQQSDQRLLTVQDVMRQLGVTRITLRRMELARVLLPIRVGRSVRYTQEAIDAYLGR
jgi:predicted DNA-binding transcriptional regulator AlpA